MDAGKITQPEVDAFEYCKRQYKFTAGAVQELDALLSSAKRVKVIDPLTLEIKEKVRK